VTATANPYRLSPEEQRAYEGAMASAAEPHVRPVGVDARPAIRHLTRLLTSVTLAELRPLQRELHREAFMVEAATTLAAARTRGLI
jgi:hypothetical protein